MYYPVDSGARRPIHELPQSTGHFQLSLSPSIYPYLAKRTVGIYTFMQAPPLTLIPPAT